MANLHLRVVVTVVSVVVVVVVVVVSSPAGMCIMFAFKVVIDIHIHDLVFV